MGMFGHDDDLFMFEYDLESAVEYWNLAMADGLDDIWKNNSYSLDLYYHTYANQYREDLCHLIKDGLESILADSGSSKTSWVGDTTHDAGTLKIEVTPIDWTTYINALRNNTLPIYFLGWLPNYSDPDDYSYFIKTTGTSPRRMGLDQDPTWDAETVDGWIEQAASTIDPATREILYHDIQEAIVEHAAYIWYYQSTSFHMEGVRFNGYTFHPMRGPYFYHYYNPLSIPDIFDFPLMILVPSAIIVSIIALVLYRTRPR